MHLNKFLCICLFFIQLFSLITRLEIILVTAKANNKYFICLEYLFELISLLNLYYISLQT